MYRHGSTAAALFPGPSAASSQTSALPTYDPRSEKARKETARLRSAEKMLHLIPVVIFLCVIILWFFSHPVSLEAVNGVHEDVSIRTRTKNGFDALEATSGTVYIEALASVDDTETEEIARRLGNKVDKNEAEEERDNVLADKEDEINTDETDTGPDEEDRASKEDQGEAIGDEGDTVEYKETDREGDRTPEETGRVAESRENDISIEDSGRSMNDMEDGSNTKEVGEAEDNEEETERDMIGNKVTGTFEEVGITGEKTRGDIDYLVDGITNEETVRSVDNKVQDNGTDPLTIELDNEVDRMTRMNLARTSPHIKEPVRKERAGSDGEHNERIGLKDAHRDVDNEEEEDDLEERCLNYKVN